MWPRLSSAVRPDGWRDPVRALEDKGGYNTQAREPSSCPLSLAPKKSCSPGQPGLCWRIMLVAVLLILVAAGYRVLAVYSTDLANITPLMALAFCGAVYLRPRGWWAVPFVALLLSDLWINHVYMAEYGYGYGGVQMAVRAACFAAALGLGLLVSRRKSWLNLLSGTLGCALLFYLLTNTASWAGDAYYAKTLGGWWQAMTVGHPQFPPTLYFFRNSLVGDLLFTGLFAVTMEARARQAGQPSLLTRAPGV